MRKYESAETVQNVLSGANVREAVLEGKVDVELGKKASSGEVEFSEQFMAEADGSRTFTLTTKTAKEATGWGLEIHGPASNVIRIPVAFDEDGKSTKDMTKFMSTIQRIENIMKTRKHAGEAIASEESFSKQHYVKVAAILKGIKQKDVREDIVAQFSSMFAEDNPRFDATRFAKAAGVTGA